MKKKLSVYLRIIFLILLFVPAFLVNAQDTIIKKNGEVIRAKIIEIGTDEIKFKLFGESESPTVTLKNSDIKTAKVSGQTVIDNKQNEAASEDIIVKKNGDLLKVKVTDIGTDEVKFKLYSNPDGPSISIKKSEIKTMKVEGQMVIDVKKTGPDEDIIVKKDGTIIKAKVMEMGTDDVKYKIYNSPDGPILSLKKSEINSVKVEGQTVYEYQPDPYSISNTAILSKASDLKFHFFSPLSHHIAFSYEWMNKPGFNWEGGFGIYGVGTSAIDNAEDRVPKGFFLRFGPKFLLGSSSDIEIEGAKYAHPLKGRYFKPEITLSALSLNYTVDTSNTWPPSGNTTSYTNKYQSLVVNLVYGRQFIFGNTITVSYYIGMGYGFETKRTIGTKPSTYWYDDFDPRRYSFWYFGENFPLTITAGFTLGYIMRTPDWLVNKKAAKSSKPPSRHSMDN